MSINKEVGVNIDTVKELAEVPVLEKAYDDLVHPSAKSVGKMLSLLPRTVAIWLSSWDRWVVNREESIARTIDAMGSRVDEIPEDHLTEPPAHIAVPAIQQLSYCYDSEDLREMYANLLLSSMDDRVAEYVHPSFVQILKEISPDEAKLLGSMAGLGTDGPISIPLIDLRIVRSNEIVPSEWKTIVSGYNECCLTVCEHPEQSLVYLGNLDRLGILKRFDYYSEADKLAFEAYESSEAIRDVMAKIELEDGKRFDFRRWSYRVTDFGQNFIKICVSQNVKS